MYSKLLKMNKEFMLKLMKFEKSRVRFRKKDAMIWALLLFPRLCNKYE